MGLTNNLGDIGEAKVVFEAFKRGYHVGKMSQNCPYDLVIDRGSGPERIQVKYRTGKDVARIEVARQTKLKRRAYDKDNIDAIVVVVGDRTALIPIEEVQGIGEITLRMSKAKNGQRRGIRYFSDFENW